MMYYRCLSQQSTHVKATDRCKDGLKWNLAKHTSTSVLIMSMSVFLKVFY